MEPVTEIERPDGSIVDLTTLDKDVTEVCEIEGDSDSESIARRCESCEDWYPATHWSEGDGRYGELSEAMICSGCSEADGNSVSTLHRFVPGEPKDKHQCVLFGDHEAYGCTQDSTAEPYQWFLDLIPRAWSGRPYTSTSGWRGYHATSTVLADLVVIENGWMTGDWSDVPHKRDSHVFLQALSDNDITPPCVMFVLFEPTSNVFSTATEILCKTEDADALRSWLAESEYDLHAALG